MKSTPASTRGLSRLRHEKGPLPPNRQGLEKDLWLCLLLFAAVLVAFIPALQSGFINFDDDLYVTANKQVQSGLTWSGMAWAFRSTEATNWHPLTWLSHMLDYQLYGPAAWGHHLTSVLLHGLNTVLLFVFLRRITAAGRLSLLVAGLFGLHPLRVESVVWVAERKDVLSAFFFLLTLFAYAQYAQRRPFVKPHRSSAFLLALLFFALGLMSKPMLVTLPFVLLLLDYWPLRRTAPGAGPGVVLGASSKDLLQGSRPTGPSWRWLVLEKTPFFLLAIASCGVTFFVQGSGGALAAPLALPLGIRLENAAVAYARYLGKTFWPHNLSFFYPYPAHWSLGAVLLSCALLLFVSLLIFALRCRASYALIGWFWFIGMLVPVIGLVQAGQQSLADRYTYLPSIGLFLAVVCGLFLLFSKPLSNREDSDKGFDKGPIPRMGVPIVLGLAILVCVPITWRQASYWHDDDTLFGHALKVTQNNHVAHDRLGVSLMRRGRRAEALGHFEEAVRIKPRDAELRGDLANALCRNARVPEGIRQYQEVIRLRPDSLEAHYNLGIALCNSQRLDEGLAEFETAVRLAPAAAHVHRSLAVALAAKGRREEAIRELTKALELQPDYPEAQDQLRALQR